MEEIEKTAKDKKINYKKIGLYSAAVGLPIAGIALGRHYVGKATKAINSATCKTLGEIPSLVGQLEKNRKVTYETAEAWERLMKTYQTKYGY